MLLVMKNENISYESTNPIAMRVTKGRKVGKPHIDQRWSERICKKQQSTELHEKVIKEGIDESPLDKKSFT